MPATNHNGTRLVVLERRDLAALFDALRDRGFQLVGPTVRDGAIVFDELTTPEDLPIGWTDRQEAGSYRLVRRGDAACFGFNTGPHSWKRYLFPSTQRLWTAKRENGGFDVQSEPTRAEKQAFIGVRACEMAAIRIQDTVFLHQEFQDPGYQARREASFVVAVNCTEAGGTCFCASLDCGPTHRSDFDLALTEVLTSGRHHFLLRAGSDEGREVLEALPTRRATDDEIESAHRLEEQAVEQMGRTLRTEGLKELMLGNPEHPHWADVAHRCESCANCTMVCPTCFCSTVEDTVDLEGDHAERWRRWDSCFNRAFSYIHGGAIRRSTASRYRQWMTHKFGAWHEQFGTCGCVGCGRCITWCPVGIDITREVEALRANPAAAEGEARP